MNCPAPFSLPEDAPPLDAWQLRAALIDLAEYGWVLLPHFDHAQQVMAAAQQAGMVCRLAEAMRGYGWLVEVIKTLGPGETPGPRQGRE